MTRFAATIISLALAAACGPTKPGEIKPLAPRPDPGAPAQPSPVPGVPDPDKPPTGPSAEPPADAGMPLAVAPAPSTSGAPAVAPDQVATDARAPAVR